ncbi:MAG TPA: hypothetical protein VHK27_07885 [Gammaproteobacteria bacterium]|nr:hypothetical protein [Gammaproteobacteria bacterium]
MGYATARKLAKLGAAAAVAELAFRDTAFRRATEELTQASLAYQRC